MHESIEIETIFTHRLCTPSGKCSFLGFYITKQYLTAPNINTHTHTESCVKTMYTPSQSRHNQHIMSHT